MSLPIIAIIGRPNVGKSTFFNRLIGERAAITSPVAGTTRDRVYHETVIGGYPAILADTAGMEFDKKKDLEADVQAQAQIAVSEANVIFFVIDATEPLTASDYDCAQYLRKSRKPIILIAHKADNQKTLIHQPQMYELGLGEPIPVSSIHNFGIPDVEIAAQKLFKKWKWKKEKLRSSKDKSIRVAIVGKPNVGKSSLVNALLGQERVVVSDIPGTTIDSTDTPLHFQDDDFVLIDTAGLRRRGKVRQGIEKYSVLRSLQAISRADVTCLVMDAGEGIANQDLHVSQYILDSGAGLIIVMNKSDLMEDLQTGREKFLARMQYRMDYMPWAPVLFVSALKRKNIFKILELAKNIAVERMKKVPADQFSILVKTSVLSHPPTRSGQKIIIYKAVQTAITPPTFTFFVNKPDLVHFSYRRFLENEIRRKFGFYGTAIKLEFRMK